MVVTSGQQYDVGEKPTGILYTCINRHAVTPKAFNKQNVVVYTTTLLRQFRNDWKLVGLLRPFGVTVIRSTDKGIYYLVE